MVPVENISKKTECTEEMESTRNCTDKDKRKNDEIKITYTNIAVMADVLSKQIIGQHMNMKRC